MPFHRPKSNRRFYLLLVLILICASALRMIGFAWGLPNERFHVSLEEDEEIFLAMLKGMDLFHADLDPNLYLHGPIVAYLWEFSLAAARLIDYADHDIDHERYAKEPEAYRHVILAGRAAAWLVGMLFLLAVALLFRNRLGDDSALLAAAFLAVAWEPVNHSHIVRHDLPTALALVLMIAQGYKVAGLGRRRDYLWMGALLGLATAVMHIAGGWLGGILFVVAHGQGLKRRGHLSVGNFINRRFWQGLGMALAIFILLVPTVVYHLPTYFHIQFNILVPSIREQDLWRVAEQSTGLAGLKFLLFSMTPHAYGIGLALLGYAAMGYGWVKKRGEWLLLLILPAVHYLSLTFQTQKFTRHLIFICAPFALLAARFLLHEFKEWLEGRVGKKAGLITAFIATVVLCLSLAQTLTVHVLQHRYDVPEKVSHWFEENVPYGAAIATLEAPVDMIIPPVDSRHFGENPMPYKIISEVGRDKKALLESGADYLVDTHFMLYGLLNKYRHDQGYVKEKEFINWLESGKDFVLVKTFDNDPGFLGSIYNIDRLPLDMHRVNLRVYVFKRVKD